MRTAFVALTLFAASLLHAQERTLVWKALDVTAKLDNDGTLRISERHRMLFDGEWNGGERVFRVEPGQELLFESISRVAADGTSQPMVEALGDGIGLHKYRFDGRTLRWRAREASDPPFRNAERSYVIEYLLRNVVERNGESYTLSHDFAFTDRPGAIETFSAKLELDSEWKAPPDFVPLHERANLPPGESAILTVQLQRTGEGQPVYLASPAAQAVTTTPEPVAPPVPPPPSASIWAKLAAFAAFGVVAILMMFVFVRREEAMGRFEPRPQVTPQWLEEHLLVHRAEVVGAAWDGATGPGEVAALIAIMTAEGKIENVAGAPKLRLLVPRHTLSDYERGFVDALFIAGDEIDPETLRRHYREIGFEPSKSIAQPLSAAASRLVGSAPRASWGLGCAAFAVSVFVFPLMAIAFAVTLGMAAAYRDSFARRGMAGVIPIPFVLAAVLHTVINDSLGWLIANLIAGIVLLAIALRVASWRASDVQWRNLRNFRLARDFLLQRIVVRDPEVDPRWIPYMLAFGLAPDDRWSVAAATRDRVPTFNDDGTSSSWPSSSSPVGTRGGGAGSPAPVFQGGGGNFGGAGATGSWASIQTFASTVAAVPPRSSSSGVRSSSSSSGSGWSWSSSGSSSSSSRSSSSSSRSSSSSSSRSGGGGGGGW